MFPVKVLFENTARWKHLALARYFCDLVHFFLPIDKARGRHPCQGGQVRWVGFSASVTAPLRSRGR